MFDPYHRWLGISRKDQPANHYRLLAIDLFESDAEVIRDAAEQRMAHIRMGFCSIGRRGIPDFARQRQRA